MLSKLIHQAIFAGAGASTARHLDASKGRDLLRKGQQPHYVTMLIDGWAASYTQLGNGVRQLHTIFLPGDFCDSGASRTGVLDYSVVALSQVRLARVPRDVFHKMIEEHPSLGRAIWRQDMIRAAMLRQHTTALGAKCAYQRLAHVLAETFLRMKARGYVQRDSCPFHMTQVDLAEFVGLTSVHVNRMLQSLRCDGLIALHSGTLTIPHMQRLLQAADLDPSYLGMGELTCPEKEHEDRERSIRFPGHASALEASV